VFREPILDGTRLYFSAPATDHAKRFRDTNADRRYPRRARYTEIVACDLSRPPEWGATLQGGWGAPTRLVAGSTARFDRLWRLHSPLKLHAKAGPRLYAGGPGTVAAIDPPAAGLPAKVSWQTAIDGTPHRMLVGDGRLFVVTLEGAILCFGSGDTPVITHSRPRDQPSAATPDSVESGRASEILRRAAVRDGYGVVLGPTDGGLVRELVRRSALRWIVLEPDAQRVAAARREFHGLGLYGPRVHVLQGELESAPLPPLFVSLVVTHSVPRSPARLFRLLRPHGGVACLCLPERDGRAFVRQAGAARLDGADLSCAGAFTLLRRPGPLPGADDWRHESGDAAHTFASRDRHVAPPFGVLWFGGELDRTIPWIEGDPPRLPGESAPSAFAGARSRPRVADGRMFIPIGDDLHAVDV